MSLEPVVVEMFCAIVSAVATGAAPVRAGRDTYSGLDAHVVQNRALIEGRIISAVPARSSVGAHLQPRHEEMGPLLRRLHRSVLRSIRTERRRTFSRTPENRSNRTARWPPGTGAPSAWPGREKKEGRTVVDGGLDQSHTDEAGHSKSRHEVQYVGHRGWNESLRSEIVTSLQRWTALGSRWEPVSMPERQRQRSARARWIVAGALLSVLVVAAVLGGVLGAGNATKSASLVAGAAATLPGTTTTFSSSPLVSSVPPSPATPSFAPPAPTSSPTASFVAQPLWDWNVNVSIGVCLGNWLVLERWMNEDWFVGHAGEGAYDEWGFSYVLAVIPGEN